jgi:hypothetical protein
MGLFALGQTVSTRGALETGINLLPLLARHARGDWGDLGKSDKQANVDAIQYGDRILSAYNIDGHKFYVITESDRSSTCVLLANEY